ncbi:MAG TPA: ABC transporter permease, partial [Thermoanaerobaculia bacterium]|nr:ABC transporter permease [Thermoanaerobaculia bacterium]
MSQFLRDVRLAGRSLARQPAMALLAILAFALGIGLVTTMFSITEGGLRDLPFERGDRLMHLERNNLAKDIESMEVTYHDLLDWREAQRSDQSSFESLAAFYQGTINLSGDGEEPTRYNGAFMTDNAFAVLRAKPVLGRTFAPGDDGPGTDRVVVIGWKLWQARFGGRPDIVGKTIRVNGTPREVIGVMPEGFLFPINEEIWTTLPHDPARLKRGQGTTLEVFGRLRDGVSADQALADLSRIAARIAKEHPDTNEGIGAVVKPFTSEYVSKEIRALLYLMLGATCGVLLIACANVANLLLARAAVKGKEVAVRSALGAGRWRVIQQMLAEALVLAGIGAVLGVTLAWFGVAAFDRAIAPTDPPFWIDIRMDAAALVVVVVATLLAGLAAGLAPALQATGSRINETLKDDSRGASSLRLGKLSRSLVVAQVAVSCVLLVLTGLMVKSVTRLEGADFGIEKEKVFSARVALFEQDYPDRAARQRFLDEVAQQLAALPGVESAALGDSMPVTGSGGERFRLEGKEYRNENDRPDAHLAAVTPSYFATVGSHLVAGRDFTTADRDGSPPVVIVNQSFARRYFGAAAPLGKRIGIDGPAEEGTEPPTLWATVVGVVPDLYMDGTDNKDPEGMYVPLAQHDRSFMSLLARTRGEPMALARPVRAMVHGIDPNQPLYFVRSLGEAIRQQTWFYRVFGTLFMVFGAVALLLAAVGLYGVMSFSVGRRRQEVGIRMALGAEATQAV